MDPKVDVIIPVHNCELYIGEAIGSILVQSYQNFQIIVINDGSTDKTTEIIENKMSTDSRVHLINSDKVGITGVLNIGLENSNAPYVGFLDADDLWKPTKLEKQLNYLQENKKELACFTMIKEFESFKDTSKPNQYKAREEAMKGMVRGTLLAKRELMDMLGKFNPITVMGEFIEWLSPAIVNGNKFHTLPEILTLRRIHDNNLTREVKTSDYFDVIKAHLKAKRKLS